MQNVRLFAGVGVERSLINSLMASANGCGSPVMDTLFGPFRSCQYPRNFRSISVQKAIAINARMIDIVIIISGAMVSFTVKGYVSLIGFKSSA